MDGRLLWDFSVASLLYHGLLASSQLLGVAPDSSPVRHHPPSALWLCERVMWVLLLQTASTLYLRSTRYSRCRDQRCSPGVPPNLKSRVASSPHSAAQKTTGPSAKMCLPQLVIVLFSFTLGI